MSSQRQLFFTVPFITAFLFCCNTYTTFDKEKWQEKGASGFLYRDKMLPDLVANYSLKGMSRKKLFELLGKPGNWQESDLQIFYPIIQKYDEPNHIKWFAIRLSSSHVVEEFKILDNREN